MTTVDTAALAAAAGRKPRTIRWYAQRGIITPVDTSVINGRGRPAMLFDLDAACDAIARHLAEQGTRMAG